MTTDAATSTNPGRRELARLWLAVLAVAVVLIGGLVAINRLLMEPSLFGDLDVTLIGQAGGRPVAGAFLELRDASGAIRATGRSDEKGRYRQGRVPEGGYLLYVGAPGHQLVEKEFRVAPGQTVRMVLHMMMASAPPTEPLVVDEAAALQNASALTPPAESLPGPAGSTEQ